MHIETSSSIPRVGVLGGLSLSCDGRRLPVPPGGRKLLAYLALHPAGVDRRAKYWPPVRRIDQAYGDRNLVCACPPPEAFVG